ncbi:MAG TPA: EF-hand domain-containing protein, partial [Candidatus Obscuribacter sp.]|nr:EF-hand domain-containing protein [Candidatus Obscuribacter sp.]
TEKFQQATVAYIIHHLQPSKDLEAIKKIFKHFDQDGNGRLSYEELKIGIIKYFGKGKEKAKIYSTISWLDIKPNGLDLQNGDEKTIAVNLAIPSVINFPIRQVWERSAILVNCNNETWSLDVNLDLKPETISPRISKNLVNIDNVTDWTKSSSDFTIHNDGTRDDQSDDDRPRYPQRLPLLVNPNGKYPETRNETE